MGWNSWNWHGKKDISEKVVEETIDAMVAHGLRDAGYRYVVVDGGWRDTKLGQNGELVSHPTRFPGGMKRLADYAHARGLKFGLHVVLGTHDCGGDAVGSFGHEEAHLRQFVEWGLDFLKLDKCKFEPGWTEEAVKSTYAGWSNRLAHCGRDIVFSLSAYVYRDWYPDVGHMARTTYDIRSRIHPGGAGFDDAVPRENHLSVMAIAEQNNEAAAFGGHGYWNDPDMLVTGKQGLTDEEQKAHFALWCVMSSPLMLGNDPRVMTNAEKELLLNRECIAVNQDPTEQGRRIKVDGRTEIWAKRLGGNKVAVLLLNRDPAAARAITLRGADVGLSGKWKARDLFAKKDLGTFDSSLTKSTPAHAAWFLLLSGL
ncbi:MAG: glycoside hydrolase family 27 protein [Opitutaceae bacterium]|nr:glycoside hydrolase family 27 protein [Opitutaceae bacterium]